ncbi:hypothetical protein Tco_1067025 [Tanacetum coccineum]|uniref:Myb/SANT-like domain-containing protein n=1 Tax=Tanacetum coccineum TaxID=301880 RepID=A0ABQ5HBP0_9ASTR
MLNDPQNQILGSSSANPNPNFPNYNPFSNPDQQILFQQWQLQQQMFHTNISQKQSDNSQQQSHEIQKEEDETLPTPLSKKPGSRGKRVKKMATRNVDPEPEPKTQAEVIKVRNFWSQDEELLLAECFIQISKDPKIGSDQKNDTFWYKILDVYNDQAEKRGFLIRTKNMLTGKWTYMNRKVGKFYSLVNETKVMSGENEENWMTRVEILYKAHTKSDFKHNNAWAFLKDKHKWKNPNRQMQDDTFRFKPSNVSRNDSTTIRARPKGKMERIDREVNSRVELNNSKKVAEDLKVLQMSTDGIDPIDAAIINAQKARICSGLRKGLTFLTTFYLHHSPMEKPQEDNPADQSYGLKEWDESVTINVCFTFSNMDINYYFKKKTGIRKRIKMAKREMRSRAMAAERIEVMTTDKNESMANGGAGQRNGGAGQWRTVVQVNRMVVQVNGERWCRSTSNGGAEFVVGKQTCILQSVRGRSEIRQKIITWVSTERRGRPYEPAPALESNIMVMLLRFVEEYGIAMCYDPQLPSSEQTALDALEGYIPLYLSLFSIGEPSLPLFISLCNVGPAGDCLSVKKGLTLVLDACSALITDFRHSLGTFAFPYPKEPFDEPLRDHLVRHPFEAQTFPKPILYLAGLASSWEDVFLKFYEEAWLNSYFLASPAKESIDVGSTSMEYAKDVDDDDQGMVAAEGKKCSITADLEDGVIVVRLSTIGRSSKLEGKKQKQECPRRTSLRGSVPPLPTSAPKGVGKHPRRKLDDLSFDDLVNVYDVHIFHVVMAGNMLANKSRILSQEHAQLKNDVVSLKSKNMSLNHRVSKLEDNLSRSQNNQDVEGSQVVKDLRSENARVVEELSLLRKVVASTEDSQKKLFEELDRLRPSEIEALSSKLKIDDLERVELIKDFLPLVVKRLLGSDHFNQAMSDLQQKTMVLRRVNALDELCNLGSYWKPSDIDDYDLMAKKIFDEAAEAFEKLEFPYISLLLENAGKSLGELTAIKPPTYQESTSSPQ